MPRVLPLAPFIGAGALANQPTFADPEQEAAWFRSLGIGALGETNNPAAPARNLDPRKAAKPPGPRYMGAYVPGNYGVGGQAQMMEPGSSPLGGGGAALLGELMRTQTQPQPLGGPAQPAGAMPPGDWSLQDMGDLPPGDVYPHVQPDLVASAGQTPTPATGLPANRPVQSQAQTMPPWSYQPPAGGVGQQQPQQQGISDAGMWGLLAAGLGILANNTGNYGSATPAIGRGGLIGLNTFLGQRQLGIENKRRDELAAAATAQQEALARYRDQTIDLQRAAQNRIISREQKHEADVATMVNLLKPGSPLEAAFANVSPDKYIEEKMKLAGKDAKEPKIEWLTTGKDAAGLDLEAPHMWDGSKFVPLPGFQSRVRSGQKPLVDVSVKTVEGFNEQSAKDQAKSLIDTFNTLQTIPSQLIAMDEAEKALKGAGGFVGAGAETKLAIAKFFNNNFGTEIAPDQVANAELLRSTLFRQIMENLKKLDAQPSQQQQKVMQESLGNLGTDPNAIPQIIRITRESLASRAKEHNRRVREAKKNGATFLYDVSIPGFDEPGKAPWER